MAYGEGERDPMAIVVVPVLVLLWPGSVCTTRKKAGVGYPQLSAVLECADAAHGLGGHIISVSGWVGVVGDGFWGGGCNRYQIERVDRYEAQTHTDTQGLRRMCTIHGL